MTETVDKYDHSQTVRVNTGSCGKLYCIFVKGKTKPVKRIHFHLGKAGTCQSAYLDAIAVLIKRCLDAGVDKEAIIKDLKGIGCHSHHKDDDVKSCPDAVAKALGVLE